MTILSPFDFVLIGAYFVVLAGVCVWSSKREQSSDEYFLAHHSASWFAVGASFFASNIGRFGVSILAWLFS